MLSHNLLGQDLVLVTATPEPVKPGKRSKEIVKIDRAKAVLNQQLIDEYWKRSAKRRQKLDRSINRSVSQGQRRIQKAPAPGTAGGGASDLAAAESKGIAPTKSEAELHQAQAHQVAIKKRKVKSQRPSEETAPTLSAESTTTGASAPLPMARSSTLVAEILRNLHAVISEHAGEAVKAGMAAFAAVDFAAINEAQVNLAAVVVMQAQIELTIDLWQKERRLPEGATSELSRIKRLSVPGLSDILNYLSVRVGEIDRELLTAVSNREYGRMQALADEATAMAGLSHLLDRLFPTDENAY